MGATDLFCVRYTEGVEKVKKKTALSLLGLSAASLVAAVLAGILLMTCAYALPTARMRYHVSLSLPYIEQEGDFYWWAPYHNSTALDGFTDCIMLGNAIYESEASPFHDALVNPRREYTPGDTVSVDSLIRYASGEVGGREVTYARYWHGYLLALKPLLLFFTPSDIRLLNMTVQLLLGALVLLLAYKRKGLALAAPLAAAFLCINPISTALCFQYTDVALLSLVSLAVLLGFRTDEKQYGCLLYLWLGIAIAFFDFLTYPLVSLGLLLTAELSLSRESLGGRLKRIGLNSAAWGVGYGGMWAGKWIVASLFSEQNVLRSAQDRAQLWTSSADGTFPSIVEVFKRNLQVYVSPSFQLLVILVIVCLVYLLVFKKYRLHLRAETLVPLILLALYPVVWTAVLKNHSVVHPHMTYRNFAITVMAALCAAADSLSPKQNR